MPNQLAPHSCWIPRPRCGLNACTPAPRHDGSRPSPPLDPAQAGIQRGCRVPAGFALSRQEAGDGHGALHVAGSEFVPGRQIVVERREPLPLPERQSVAQAILTGPRCTLWRVPRRRHGALRFRCCDRPAGAQAREETHGHGSGSRTGTELEPHDRGPRNRRHDTRHRRQP
jgi:hypothetical protein